MPYINTLSPAEAIPVSTAVPVRNFDPFRKLEFVWKPIPDERASEAYVFSPAEAARVGTAVPVGKSDPMRRLEPV